MNSAVLEVIMTRNFLSSRLNQVWSHTITQAIPKSPLFSPGLIVKSYLKQTVIYDILLYILAPSYPVPSSINSPEICCFSNLDHMILLIILKLLKIWTVVKCCNYPKSLKTWFCHNINTYRSVFKRCRQIGIQ